MSRSFFRSLLIFALAIGAFAPESGAVLQWRLISITGPAPRGDSFLAYDSIRQKAVCFGGFLTFVPIDTYDDTWEWDGVNWNQVTVTGPSRRHGAGSMAFDKDRGVMVLLSGVNVYPMRDTWEYNGQSWVLRVGRPQVVANGSSLTYDAARREVVQFGGGVIVGNHADTHTYSGGLWQIKATTGPSERIFPGLCYDSARQKVVLFGGRWEDPNNPGATTFFDDTWEWDGTRWQQIFVPGPSPRNVGGMMVYHPGWGKSVLWGGAGIGFSPRIDTWTYDGSQWQQLSVASPSNRYSALWFDEVRGTVCMFGGYSVFPAQAMNETWELSDSPGPTWTPTPLFSPSPSATPTITPSVLITPTPTPTSPCDQSNIWINGVPCNQRKEPCDPIEFLVHDGNPGGVDLNGISVLLGGIQVPFQTRLPNPADPSDVMVNFVPAGYYPATATLIDAAYVGPCGYQQELCKIYFRQATGRILFGGYMDTRLTASGGTLRMTAIAGTGLGCTLPSEAKILYQGVDSGLRIPQGTTPGTYLWSLYFNPGIPTGRFLMELELEVGGGRTSRWPYFTVE